MSVPTPCHSLWPLNFYCIYFSKWHHTVLQIPARLLQLHLLKEKKKRATLRPLKFFQQQRKQLQLWVLTKLAYCSNYFSPRAWSSYSCSHFTTDKHKSRPGSWWKTFLVSQSVNFCVLTVTLHLENPKTTGTFRLWHLYKQAAPGIKRCYLCVCIMRSSSECYCGTSAAQKQKLCS